MRKPSIFSRDYERKVRKRKRIIVTISILLFLLIGAIALKLTREAFDFTYVRAKIQKWIDEEPTDSNIVDEENNGELQNDTPVTPETPIVPEVKTMDIKLSEDKIIKVEYDEVDGKIKFKEAKEVPIGISYDINPLKDLIVVTDDKQNIRIFNTKGEEKNITKDKYVAPNGEIFKKDVVTTTYKDYLWHNNAKFINDNKIVYKTNMPYFGFGLNQYLWIVDIEGKNEVTLWQSKGKEIIIGENKEKGTEVTIDGVVKYISNDNKLVN